MKEHFYKSAKLSPETLKALRQKSDHPALAKVLMMLILFIGFSFAVIWAWDYSIWLLIPALIGYGMMTCSLFAAEHELIHNTAFKSLFLNRFFALITGVLFIYPATMMRELHFTHHRYTHIPGKDPEISLGGKPIPSIVSNLPSYLMWLSGLPLLLMKCMMTFWAALGMPEFIRKMLFPFVDPKVRGLLFFDSILVLAFHTGIALLAIYYNPAFWGLFIGQIIGHCFLASYTAAEHNGLSHKGNILNRTRSIKTPAFVRWLMWNMPYHAEHHAYPAIPFHALPQLHDAMEKELIHKKESHPSFHLKVLKKTTVGGKDF